MSKKKKTKKPRNRQLHEVLANTKSGRHLTGKKDKKSRREAKEFKEMFLENG